MLNFLPGSCRICRFRQAPPLPPAPPKIAAESVPKMTSKNDTQKIKFGTPKGFPLGTQWEPKITKTWSQEHHKRQLEHTSEKASEKAPILSARTCQNHGRVFQNHTFQVFSRGLKNDSQRPRFWRPSGLPNPNKPSPGGSPKNIEKWVP